MIGDEQPIDSGIPRASPPADTGRQRSPLVVVRGPDAAPRAPDSGLDAGAAELRFEAERTRSMLDLRSRQLEEAARRESSLMVEMEATRAAAREREEEAAEVEVELLARAIAGQHLSQQLRSLQAERSAAQETEEHLRAVLAGAEAEAERATKEAEAQRRLADARAGQLTETKALLRDANGQRRVLARRAAKLEELQASHGYRMLRILWRIEGAFLRPFRALRRSGDG